MSIHKCDITVRYAETDQMGVVHHSVYPVYYEQARVQMLEDNGVDMARMEIDTNIVLPVKEIKLNYIASAFFGDKLTVFTKVKHASKVKILLKAYIENQKGEKLNEFEIKLGLSDKDTGKIVRMPDNYYEQFSKLVKE